MKQIELVKNVLAVIEEDSFSPVGSWGWRVIVKFKSNIPTSNTLIKEYYVWLEKQYLEVNKIDFSQDSIESYALLISSKKFENSNKQVPIENGISFGVDFGEIIVDPKDYQPIV